MRSHLILQVAAFSCSIVRVGKRRVVLQDGKNTVDVATLCGLDHPVVAADFFAAAWHNQLSGLSREA